MPSLNPKGWWIDISFSWTTLPETNSSPRKINGWVRWLLLLGRFGLSSRSKCSFSSKRSPTGPTEQTPKLEYIVYIARSQLMGSIGIGSIQFLTDFRISGLPLSSLPPHDRIFFPSLRSLVSLAFAASGSHFDAKCLKSAFPEEWESTMVDFCICYVHLP